ncbi:MAG TPA: hypothetical protein VFV34_26150 [Blastocatellia bacterium]|nr:hypothetical protein [Blastocatellia bacterium]
MGRARQIMRSGWSLLLRVHFLGTLIAFGIFSYQYAKEHGFGAWLLFGEITPALKAIVWEVFMVLALVAKGPSDPAAIQKTNDPWWISEYPDLVKKVSSGDNKSLSASYRTGPSGQGRVELRLSIDPKGALVAHVRPPREAFSTSGSKETEALSLTISIRDRDLDGRPDDFTTEPPRRPAPTHKLTQDGFIEIGNGPEDEGLLTLWSIGISFSVNYFLHSIDSVQPRRP